MKLHRIMAVLVVLACAAHIAFAQSADLADSIPLDTNSEMKGFRVPTYDDDNIMTSQIYGDSARVLPDGNVEITGLRMEFYAYEGEGVDAERKTEMTVTSPRCFFNRNRGVVVSDSDVRISRSEMVVTGTGFRYNNANRELKILSNSKVVLKGAVKQKGLEGESRD